MIWSDPTDRSARASNSLASTVDIAPTILQRAGVRPYNGMQGKSFIAATRGKPGPRNDVMIEFNDSGKRMGFDSPARVRVLVTDKWHLAVYKGEPWGELYDRHADPNHLHNLWDSDEHATTRAELVMALTHHLIGQMDESPRSALLA